jgi:hypothetical protein
LGLRRGCSKIYKSANSSETEKKFTLYLAATIISVPNVGIKTKRTKQTPIIARHCSEFAGLNNFTRARKIFPEFRTSFPPKFVGEVVGVFELVSSNRAAPSNISNPGTAPNKQYKNALFGAYWCTCTPAPRLLQIFTINSKGGWCTPVLLCAAKNISITGAISPTASPISIPTKGGAMIRLMYGKTFLNLLIMFDF